MYYKPTDLHSYLLHSSLHPSHFKNSIPFSRFLRHRRLCSDDSYFFHESMCQFCLPYFCRSSGSPPRATYWSTVITTNVTDNIPTAFSSLSRFTLTTTPLSLKTLSYSKMIHRLEVLSFRNLHSFHSNATKKGNFLVRSSFQTNDQPGTSKCARARCKTCPFIHNAANVVTLNDIHNVICVVCKSRPCSSRLVVLISSASLIWPFVSIEH